MLYTLGATPGAGGYVNTFTGLGAEVRGLGPNKNAKSLDGNI